MYELLIIILDQCKSYLLFTHLTFTITIDNAKIKSILIVNSKIPYCHTCNFFYSSSLFKINTMSVKMTKPITRNAILQEISRQEPLNILK